MPRQTLTKTTAPGKNPTAGQLITWTVEDIANHSAFVQSSRDVLLIWNTHAVTAYTYTFYGPADERGRSITIGPTTINAGEVHVFGPTDVTGWVQSDGKVYVDANNASVKFAVVSLP